MTKPTGRPRGRPKTKEYKSVTIRFPLAFLEQLQHYAKLKRQTMSDVLRDGAQVLLADVDPYHPSLVSDVNGGNLSDTKENSNTEIVSDAKTEPVPPARPVPDFDPDRYVLGAKLCGGKHEYGNTGRTLLTLRGKKCVQCQTEKQRQRRVAARRVSAAVA